MEHPLINGIEDLTMEELMSKINELRRKYNWAARTNAGLASQIGMAIETYQNRYRMLQDEQDQKALKGSGNDYSDKINVS